MYNNMSPDFLKKLKAQKKYSQEFLARKIEVSRSTYARIEKGQTEVSIKQAQILAGLYGIKLEDFINERASTEINANEQEIRIGIPSENLNKFKQVFLYIIKQVGAHPNVGETVLYKLLYFIDFDFYEKYEKQLLGLSYVHNRYGPTPVSASFRKVIEGMKRENLLEEAKTKFFNNDQKKYLPRMEPDLSVISPEEKAHIDWELKRLGDMTATEISELSHKDVPWIITKDCEAIPYESVFYRTKETSARNYDGDKKD